MFGDGSLESNLLKRVLTDPATGLPSALYFDLIKEWEARRAGERGGALRVVEIEIRGAEPVELTALERRLCRVLRTTDLVASEGHGHYRVLLALANPAEADRVRDRLLELVESPGDLRAGASHREVRVDVTDANQGVPGVPSDRVDRRRN
ncbi:MAG: hypothetical protein M3081_12715 [Gemmatimonadota bacterium]|nr:hypothetical protein [Gemmatimonadota bacterium]